MPLNSIPNSGLKNDFGIDPFDLNVPVISVNRETDGLLSGVGNPRLLANSSPFGLMARPYRALKLGSLTDFSKVGVANGDVE